MSTLEHWLQEQTNQGRHLYLVLDSDGQLDERKALASELGSEHYRNLYMGTPADSLATVAPYLFQLTSAEHPTLQALLNTPERHWGWLASAAHTDLDTLTRHWHERLVTGVRPNQALYRFHDNRVLGRALAYLQPEQHAEYLGPMTSVCYWQAEQWTVTDNPDPAQHPLPLEPAWLNTPTPQASFIGVQFVNARRYLMREDTENLIKLAEHQDVDSWLRDQLDLARTWGWQEPQQIHFLLMQNLQASGYAAPEAWLPKPEESPAMHFDRVHQEQLYWQGGAV